uniref:Uncharacterized protein n=1 Tax=Pectinophora gossypiella TaxID=13191 RepID=A0A1E1WND7_PECGO
MAKLLLNECVTINNQSKVDCDSKLPSFVDDDSEILNITRNQIQKSLASIQLIVDDLNKMREKVAHLELNLLSRVNGSTWKDISDLIGSSNTVMMNECMKILAPEDGTSSNRLLSAPPSLSVD